MSLKEIPLYTNKESISLCDFSEKYLTAKQAPDVVVPEELRFPAVLVSHCVEAKRTNHNDTHKNLKCTRQVWLTIVSRSWALAALSIH